jgi:hypothetical protein
MKNTTRITLRSALYTVLLISSTMLAADGGGETPSPAATPQHPGPIESRASLPGSPMRLDDGQLDAVKAGQLQLPPILSGDAPTISIGNTTICLPLSCR